MSDTAFQTLASAQGKHFEAHVRQVLTFRGWTITNDKPVKVPGGEVDIIATDPTGQQWWIECKGSWRNVPGLERHDTLLKAIATAWAKDVDWEGKARMAKVRQAAGVPLNATDIEALRRAEEEHR